MLEKTTNPERYLIADVLERSHFKGLQLTQYTVQQDKLEAKA